MRLLHGMTSAMIIFFIAKPILNESLNTFLPENPSLSIAYPSLIPLTLVLFSLYFSLKLYTGLKQIIRRKLISH